MEKIIVKLPYITEEIYIGDKMLNFIVSKIKSRKYDQHFIVIDAGAKKDHVEYFNKLIKILSVVAIVELKSIPSCKSFKECENIINKLIKFKASRRSCLISIGGGYISDITGYIASSYMRGIDFIQVPTTLMSMVDSVIGKVAINFEKNKNLLGSFYSPRYVFSDLSLLSNLDVKEKILGLSEVWKHALIKRNMGIIKKINSCLLDFSEKDYPELIRFSIKTKKVCVVNDYDDSRGEHKLLSLGHTFANFLEKKPSIRHGAAVVYGIVFEATLSKNLGELSLGNYNLILDTAKKFETNLKLLKYIQKTLKIEKAIEGFFSDKICDNGMLNFVLPTDSGCLVQKNVHIEYVILSLKEFKGITL